MECTALHERLYGRPLRYRQLSCWAEERPSFVLVSTDEASCGFCTGVEWAPDILEVDNILVHPDHQDNGWGSALLRALAADARNRYSALLVSNSDLHAPGVSGKRPAVDFFRLNGFRQIAATPSTRLMWCPLS